MVLNEFVSLRVHKGVHVAVMDGEDQILKRFIVFNTLHLQANIDTFFNVNVPGVGTTAVEPRFTTPYATEAGLTDTAAKPGVTVALTVDSGPD